MAEDDLTPTNYFDEGQGFKGSIDNEKMLLLQLIAQHGTDAQGIYEEARARSVAASQQAEESALKGPVNIPPALAQQVAAEFTQQRQQAEVAAQNAAWNQEHQRLQLRAADSIYKDMLKGDTSLQAGAQRDIDAFDRWRRAQDEARTTLSGGGGGGGGGGYGRRGYGRRGRGGRETAGGFYSDEEAGIPEELLDQELMNNEREALRWMFRERSSPWNKQTIQNARESTPVRSPSPWQGDKVRQPVGKQPARSTRPKITPPNISERISLTAARGSSGRGGSVGQAPSRRYR